MIRSVIFLIGIFLLGCQQKQETNSSDSSIHKSSINEPDIPLTYSNDWEYMDSDIDGIAFFLFYRNNANGFRENINLMSENLSPEMDLRTYANNTLTYLKSIKHKKILDQQSTTVDEKDAKILEYEADLTGKYLYYYQQYMVDSGRSYVLTYSSDIEDAQALKSEVKEIFASFKLPD